MKFNEVDFYDYINSQLSLRAKARKEFDFVTANLVQKTLLGIGVSIEDKPDGLTEWRKNSLV